MHSHGLAVEQLEEFSPDQLNTHVYEHILIVDDYKEYFQKIVDLGSSFYKSYDLRTKSNILSTYKYSDKIQDIKASNGLMDVGTTVLDLLIYLKDGESIDILISKYPDLCYNYNELGELPIHTASRIGDKYIFNKVFIDDISINNKSKHFGYTPIHCASLGKVYLDMIEYLVSLGADINSRDSVGTTPLLQALLKINKKNDLDILINLGADINAKDDYDETALHYATTGYDVNDDVVYHLVSLLGEDVLHQNNLWGKSPAEKIKQHKIDWLG